MKKEYIVPLLIMFVLLVVPLVSAAGVCALDKEQYHPGEIASFTCTCTLPNEELVDGDIVWRNSSGDILQNVSTNSGLCRTSFFGDTFTFPTGADYLGNATFETGSVQWAGDTVSDDFNVTGAHATDCVIEDIMASNMIRVGATAAVEFKIKDGITGESIVHASCITEGQDTGGEPLIYEPSAPGNAGYRMTNAEGEVSFQHKLDEVFWEPNTTYQFEFYCFSLPNVSHVDVDHVGFLEDSGIPAGMKTCTAQTLFSTNGEDLRPRSNISTAQALIYYSILSVILILFAGFLIVGIKAKFENEEQMTRDGWAIVKVTGSKYLKVICLWIAYGLFLIFISTILAMMSQYILFQGVINTFTNIYTFLLALGWGINLFTLGLLFILVWKDIVWNKTIIREGRALIKQLSDGK